LSPWRIRRLNDKQFVQQWMSNATHPISLTRYVQENRKMRFQETFDG
jgi:hypothetical protein